MERIAGIAVIDGTGKHQKATEGARE